MAIKQLIACAALASAVSSLVCFRGHDADDLKLGTIDAAPELAERVWKEWRESERTDMRITGLSRDTGKARLFVRLDKRAELKVQVSELHLADLPDDGVMLVLMSRLPMPPNLTEQQQRFLAMYLTWQQPNVPVLHVDEARGFWVLTSLETNEVPTPHDLSRLAQRAMGDLEKVWRHIKLYAEGPGDKFGLLWSQEDGFDETFGDQQ